MLLITVCIVIVALSDAEDHKFWPMGAVLIITKANVCDLYRGQIYTL